MGSFWGYYYDSRTKKGRDGCAYFVLGALLGPFGFIIALLLDPLPPVKEKFEIQSDTIDEGRNLDLLPATSATENDSANLYSSTHKPIDQDFSSTFITNWPVIPLSSSLVFSSDKTNLTLISFRMRNTQKESIRYSEWSVNCFDILERKIELQEPLILKIEIDIPKGEIYEYTERIELPKECRKVEFTLLHTLFENGDITHFEKVIPHKVEVKVRTIAEFINSSSEFTHYLYENLALYSEPLYIHDKTSNGWVCSYCGTFNTPDQIVCKQCEAPLEKHRYLNEQLLLKGSELWEKEHLKGAP